MRFVAFLRAVNVGRRTVRMEELRRHVEACGFRDVSTYIASGNVIFETRATRAPSLERKLERHLESALGFDVGVFVRTRAEIAAIVARDPFPQEPGTPAERAINVCLLRDAPTAEVRRWFLAKRGMVDDFTFGPREIYWLRRRELGESALERIPRSESLDLEMTVRNWRTMAALATR